MKKDEDNKRVYDSTGTVDRHYDVEMDRAAAAHGKLDTCVKLSGDDNEMKAKVSIVRTDPNGG